MKQYFTFIFLLIALHCNAQNFQVSGVVLNQETRLPVGYITVSAKNTAGTTTNQKGNFNISVGSQDSIILVSCIGFETAAVRIYPNKSFYTVMLIPGKSALAEVVVTGVSKATLARENPIPVIGVSTKKLEQTMGTNVIDALTKNAPGLNAVKTGPNISKPFIRGLGYNRVLTLYDGIRQEGQQWGDEHGIEVDGYNIDRAE
ncbi:MAG: TonB-dependent receptor, partial [Sphingobacteriaceae bacterium]